MLKKIIAFSISFCLIFEQSGFAQVAPGMHVPGYMARLVPPEIFHPVQLRAISFDPAAEKLSLFLDPGDTKPSRALDTSPAAELYKYFQIGLRLPNDLFWVNLRPDSPRDIIDPHLEKTDVGKILLAADLQLKKDLALFTSPDRPEGKRYWDKLYAKAESLFGQTDMEIPTFTRPWIVPGEIIIRESKDGAYIYKAGLRVMLEQDYLKDSPFFSITDPKQKGMNAYSSELLRAEILPKLTREVNSAKRYAALRQVYYSLVLAQWFKQKAQGQANPFSQAIDTKDLSGLTALAPWDKNTYYNAYKKSFSEGEYKKEEQVSTASGLVIRAYFSGGVQMDGGKSHTISGRSNNRLKTQGIIGLTPPQVDALLKDINFLLLQPDGRSPITRSFSPGGNTLPRAAPLAPGKAMSEALRNKALLHAFLFRIFNNPDPASREQLLTELRENAKDGGIMAVIASIIAFLQTPDAIAPAAFLAWIGSTTGAAFILRTLQNKHIDFQQGLAILALGGSVGSGVALSLAARQSGIPSFDILSLLNLKLALPIIGFTEIPGANGDGNTSIKDGGSLDSRYEYIKGYLKNSAVSGQPDFEVISDELLELFRVLDFYMIRDNEMMSLVSEFVHMVNNNIDKPDKVYAYIEIMKEHSGGEERSKYDLYAGFLKVLLKSDYERVPLMPMLRDFAKTTWLYLYKTTEKNPLSIEEFPGGSDQSKDGGTGGIDFRALPLVTQPGMNPSMMQPAIDMKALQVLAQQSKMRDLDKEWSRIEKQIAGKVMPYEKIKEYLAVCSDRKASGENLSRVEQCLSNILKLEEVCAVSTSDRMKELLLIVETVRT